MSTHDLPFQPHITRRDFLNGVLLGTGAALLSCTHTRSPGTAAAAGARYLGDDWYGYGGVGDYRFSHGNTPEAIRAAHRVRDGALQPRFDDVETTEECDLVIVGAGFAGLGAAFEFMKRTSGRTCIMLDNHPVFGGEAKENEFAVEGVKLLAPQGSNGFFIPPSVTDPEAASGDPRWYAELGVPREFRLREPAGTAGALRFSPDNYEYMVPRLEHNTSVGHFIEGQWTRDIWQHRLADTPWPEASRRTLLAWHAAGASGQFASDAAAMHRLDTMSYERFLTLELGLGAEAARYADLFLASAVGLGSDAVSAYAAYKLPMPGLTEPLAPDLRRTSFPGGNSGFARYFIKRLIPNAIAGGDRFDDIITERINLHELDRGGRPLRIKLDSTAVSVQHAESAAAASHVNVIYLRDGRLHGIRARAVIMATGGWMNLHVVRDLPHEHREAYRQFVHAPYLVANVALTNWRFLARVGITAAIWDRDESGFGYTCNLRNPMQVGDHQPPLDPDQPAVLTFYTPFHRPGLPMKEQVTRGRIELLGTSYLGYERKIHAQLLKLFASAGFDAKRDVAGLILNRWGHAFSVPFVGFFGGASGTAPRDTIRTAHGRIAFGHSELEGWQHWGNAADEGRRAFIQIADRL